MDEKNIIYGVYTFLIKLMKNCFDMYNFKLEFFFNFGLYFFVKSLKNNLQIIHISKMIFKRIYNKQHLKSFYVKWFCQLFS